MKALLRSPGSALMLVFFCLTIAFLFFPIMVILPMSFSNGETLQFPPQSRGFRWYEAYFSDDLWRSTHSAGGLRRGPRPRPVST